MTAYLSDLLEIAPAFFVTRTVYLTDRLITVASVLADALVWLLLFVAVAWEMGVEADREVEG